MPTRIVSLLLTGLLLIVALILITTTQAAGVKAADAGLQAAPETTSTPIPIPSNNDFANATVITSLPFHDAPDVEGATVASDDPHLYCDTYYTNTIWYQYTPAVDQRLIIDGADGGFEAYPILAIFTGTEGNLSEVDCEEYAGQNVIDLQVTAGTTYTIMEGLQGWMPPTTPTVIQFNVQEFVPVANDLVANATVIPSVPFSRSQEVYGSALDATDPHPVCSAAAANSFTNTVWYSYTAASDQSLYFSASTNRFNTLVAVYTGSEGSMTEITCSSQSPSSGADFIAHSGVTYSIMVADASTHPTTLLSTVNVSLTAFPFVPNDDPASATPVLSLPFSTSQDIYGSTTGFGEPTTKCLYDSQPYHYPNTVWYQFAPSTTQSLQISTHGSAYSTIIAVYTGTAGNLTQIRCEDYERLSMVAQGGTTYWVMIGNYGPNNDAPPVTGSTSLQVSFSAPPVANDLIQDAQPISFPASITQDIYGATLDPTDIASCISSADATLWYTYTPASDQHIVLNTTSSDFQPTVEVFTGSVGNLTQVQCALGGVGMTVQAGVTYTIGIAHHSITGSTPYPQPNMMLRLNLSAPTVTNDLASDAKVIPPDATLPYTVVQDVNGATQSQDDPSALSRGGTCGSNYLYSLDRLNTVWYQFTPSTSEYLILNSSGSDYRPFIQIFTSTVPNTTALTCGNGVVELNAQASTTYYIEFAYEDITNIWPLTVPTFLRFSLGLPRVSNDVAVNALNMSVPYSNNQNVFEATVGGNEVYPLCGYVYQSVWYRYTADVDRSVFLNTAGSNYDTSIAVYDDNFNLEGCSLGGVDGSAQASVRLNMQAGQTYYFLIFNGAAVEAHDPATLNISLSADTSNDLIANARVIPGSTLSYRDIFDLDYMTRSADEPPISCSAYGTYGYNNSVWRTYTPDHLRFVTVRSLTNTSFLMQAVYSGTPDNLTLRGCNKGGGDVNYPVVTTFIAQPGTTYYIMTGNEGTGRVLGMLLDDLSLQGMNIPDPPSLLSPGADAEISNTQPTFSWTAEADTVEYELFVGTNNPPETLVYVGTATHYTPPAPMVAGATYYWRVRTIGVNNLTQDWSETRTLTITSPDGAGVITNYYTTPQVTLTWDHVNWAEAYDIQVSRSASFNGTLDFALTVSSEAQSVTTTPFASGVYYWRVRARNSTTTGAWSTPILFAVNPP